jgi:hypothetical protein
LIPTAVALYKRLFDGLLDGVLPGIKLSHIAWVHVASIAELVIKSGGVAYWKSIGLGFFFEAIGKK